MNDELPLGHGIFGRLRLDAGELWEAYVTHPFVRALGRGTLPQPAFQYFLKQDYLFLIHFARAYALAAYKSHDLADIRAAAAALTAIVDIEMPLHVGYCAQWGLSEAQMAAEPEALETMAYTRFVLERGLSGDRLDLDAALIPCVVGYGEAVARVITDPSTVRDRTPYATWMDAYASADYRRVASAAILTLDRLAQAAGGTARYASLLATFQAATRLEIAFWDMAMAVS